MATRKSEMVIRELLEPVGIQINGKEPWDIQVHNPHFFDRVLSDAHLVWGNPIWMAGGTVEAIDKLFESCSTNSILTSVSKGTGNFFDTQPKRDFSTFRLCRKLLKLASVTTISEMISIVPCWING